MHVFLSIFSIGCIRIWAWEVAFSAFAGELASALRGERQIPF